MANDISNHNRNQRQRQRAQRAKPVYQVLLIPIRKGHVAEGNLSEGVDGRNIGPMFSPNHGVRMDSRNPSTAAVTSAGFSSCTQWPAPSISCLPRRSAKFASCEL